VPNRSDHDRDQAADHEADDQQVHEDEKISQQRVAHVGSKRRI
jgi:hypothetical protein